MRSKTYYVDRELGKKWARNKNRFRFRNYGD